MLSTFLTIFNQMLRIFMLLALGFLFNKAKLIHKSAETVLSRFSTMLFVPCLVLYTYTMECDLQNLITYSSWILYGGIYIVVGIILAYLLANKFSGGDKYLSGVYRYAFAMPNISAGAMPLLMAMFGTYGLFLYQMFSFVQGLTTYNWGMMQVIPDSGRHGFTYYLSRIFNLNFICSILGVILGLTGAKNWIPPIVLSTMSELGNCYVPVALLLIGFTLADYPVFDMIGDVKIYLFALLRLIVIPGMFLAFVYLAKLPSMLAMLFVLLTGCPCGMNVVVFPAAYGEDCKPGASMVLVTSILALVTLPLMYTLVTALCGVPVVS